MMIFSSIFCKTFLVLFRSLFPCCISMNCLPSFQEQPQCLQDLLEPSSLTFNTSEFHPGVDTNFNCLLLLETFIIIISLFIKEYRDSGARREETKQKTGALLEEIEELHGKIARRKAQYKFVNVTLDAATAHPSLLLSEDRRQVTWQEEHQDLPSSTQRFHSYPCVLGQLHISSGRAYWEVKVEGALSWDLGICIDNVTRKGSITVSPQNGFWAIRLYKGEYWALTSPETCLTIREKPFSVGIFLDYDAGDVSYYNMTDGSHIFSFTQITFSRAIRPLFRLWSPDSGSLTICPWR
ncbi:butyrophilin subfamily 1 member A1-like isoform X3 [Vulpes lagopus]|uniref:butyrophilin subfamily 1 member A1-like isoform X3 n=1 Tax=Vulpes lagopus TaxID=494514 RepID=UPI001BC8DAAD|nr:butyrophilin subfamily 1 member A1-like isoform X3 [Vulpes lagopus]